MKKLTAFFFLLNSTFTFAQLRSFDNNGKKTKLLEETVQISVTPSSQKSAFPIAAVGAAAITAGIGITRTALQKREESFTATYSATYTGEPFFRSNYLQIGQIEISKTAKDKNGTNQTPTNIILKSEISTFGNLFRFKVDAISFPSSKARIKKLGKIGKTIDLSITIALTGFWREYEFDESNPSKVKKVSLKSASLGESTIIVKNLKPQSNKYDYSAIDENSLYSDFFQLIPQAPSQISLEDNRGWYTLKITVKEANPYGLNSNKLSNYLLDNNDNITDFFKAFIPEKD